MTAKKPDNPTGPMLATLRTFYEQTGNCNWCHRKWKGEGECSVCNSFDPKA